MENDLVSSSVKRLSIYIGESDLWQKRPLYLVLLETLKTQGLAGATITRGVAGFGARSRIHTAAILRLSEDLPMIIEVVDSLEKINAALETIYPMVREGLITLEDVQVLKYTHRYLNPLPADRPVEDVMSGEVFTLFPQQSIHAAWQSMLHHRVKAMPVIDETARVLGMLTDEDLMERAGLQQRLSVASRIDKNLIRAELDRLAESTLTVADVMTAPPLTVRAVDPLSTAVNRLRQVGLKRLPVVDEDGKLVGMLSRFDIFQQVLPFSPVDLPPVSFSNPPQQLAEIMSPQVPAVQEKDKLAVVVETLLHHQTHRLIVVNADGRVSGILSDADVIGSYTETEKPGILAALRRLGKTPHSDKTAADFMSPDPLHAAPETDIVSAIQLMLREGRKWLVIVDEDKRPLGLVDRQILLEALASLPAKQ